jgi:hypothetical protein
MLWSTALVLHLLLLGFTLIDVATNIIRFVGELLGSHGHTYLRVTKFGGNSRYRMIATTEEASFAPVLPIYVVGSLCEKTLSFSFPLPSF